MGDYTEFHFNAALKTDTPQSVIRILSYLRDDGKAPSLPDHEFFKTSRFDHIFTGGSAYFDAITSCIFTLNDDLDSKKNHYLSVRSNLKNYDEEIEKFCDWIYPYLDKSEGDFLGFYRSYETQIPTLIYYGWRNILFARPEVELELTRYAEFS